MLTPNLQPGRDTTKKKPRLTGPANARGFGAILKVMLRFWDEGETFETLI